jgi:serine/threonine-protein kinase HipA
VSGAQLEVHLYGRHVADVLDAGFGDVAVRYTAVGLAAGPPARLSLALPLREKTYASVAHGSRWARSLLPEGRALDHAVREYQVPESDRLSLLSVLGRDVAGALVIVPAGEPVADPRAAYEPLTPDELADLLARAHDLPLGLDRRRGVKLSLAGMQDKLLLHRPPTSRTFSLPVHGAPSTLIVKPEPPAEPGRDFTGLASNEVFCLGLAAACGLEAASGYVRTFGTTPALFVRRYDRRYETGGQVVRIHQEDLLSAMGKDPALKYERGVDRQLSRTGGFADLEPIRRDPGPGLDEFATLLEDHLGRASLLRLTEILTFNTLIGNADAHARNLSLLLRHDGTVALAPLYDLVCTRAYPDIDRETPQLVDDVSDIDEVTVGNIVAHATRWELPAPLVDDRVRRLLRRATGKLAGAVEAAVEVGADPDHAAAVATVVGKRAEQLLACP